MNITFQMPSWKTGVQKRLTRISFEQIRDAILVILFFIGLILFIATPIVLAYLTPPTVEFAL